MRIYAKDLGLSDEEFQKRIPVIAQMEGSKRADALAEIQKETKQRASQARALQDKISVIENLENNRYLSGAVGPNRLTRLSPLSILTGGKQNFIASVEQLSSQEVLDALTDLKAKGGTLGALNEKELETLQNSATKINNWAVRDDTGKVVGYNTSERSFKKELERIRKLAQKAKEETQPRQNNNVRQQTTIDINALRSKYNY